MQQSTSSFPLLDPSEFEFMAEDEFITITPNFQMDTISALSGNFGPFRPLIPIQVPLWLAVRLKKAKKCRIIPPDWLKSKYLTNELQQERLDDREFRSLPFHYLEISSLLFRYAPNDIPQISLVKSLIAEIEAVRGGKIREGLQSINPGTRFIKLNNISALELNTIRAPVTQAMNYFRKLNEGRNILREVNDKSQNESIDINIDKEQKKRKRNSIDFFPNSN